MLTILIVEDNLTFRRSLREMLGERFPAIKLEEAGDAAEGFRIVQVIRPDLVFIDVRLPGENGLELTRRIKKEYSETNVIVITNHDLAEYREAAYRYGADHFIPKADLNWDDLTALVESLLLKGQSHPGGVWTGSQ
jgi:DNA-binding NarL/FixJ family response regulator